MMRLFAHNPSEIKTTFVVSQNYQSLSKSDCTSVMIMYQESLYQSYFQLWKSSPASFSNDILQCGDTPEQAIDIFSKKIAMITIEEWAQYNLASVIAYEDKKVIGFALYGKDNENLQLNTSSYYLYYIGISPSHFRMGLGTEIMLSMLNDCQNQAVKNEDTLVEMKLHTRTFNTPAIRLYEKFGFYILANDITHGHNDNYHCYFNQFDPRLEIKPLKRGLHNSCFERK